MALLAAVAFAGRALWAGQDVNWDRMNYHQYAAYALLHWRYPLDMAPGGFQGWFNPLPYLLPYALSAALSPPLAAVGVAVVQSAVAPLAWLVAGAVQQRPDPAVRACATVAGVGSAMAISEIGTSFADLPLAAPVLGAVLALLRWDGAGRRALWAAGGLVGAATGLKLTNGMFVPGLVLAVLAGAASSRLQAAAVALAGVGLGFALTGGWWAAYLWWTLGNPVFPGMNRLFQAPSAALSNYTDARFLPAGWLDALTYPWRISAGGHPTAEAAFQDPRFAAMLALFAVALARGRGGGSLGRAGLFTAGAYAVWLGLFAIARYAVAIDILAGLLAVQAAAAAAPERLARVAACAGALALVAGTRAPDWWHLPWSDAYAPRPPPALSEPAAFAIVSHPAGYWVPALPRASRFYSLSPMGLAGGGVLRDRVAAGLAVPPGGQMWTLGMDLPMDPAARASLAAQGLAPSAPCVRAPSFMGPATVFCRLVRAAADAHGVALLAAGDTVSFASEGSGWIYEGAGWGDANAVGTWVVAGAARLMFRPDTEARPLMVRISPPPAGLDVIGQAQTALHADVEGAWACVWTDAAMTELIVRTRPGSAWNQTVRSLTLQVAEPQACPREAPSGLR